MSVISTRTCYISSEENVTQDSRAIQLNFPSQLFNYPPTSKLRVVLNSFSCQRTFYKVNQDNNTFYLFDVTSNTLYPIVIEQGDYISIAHNRLKTNLAAAISAAFDTAQGSTNVGCTIGFDTLPRHFRITALTNVTLTNYKFVSFSIKGALDIAGLNGIPSPSDTGLYNDVDQLLGGQPTRQATSVNDFNDFFTIAPSVGVLFESKYPATLQTSDGIYVRLSGSLPTNNLETTNLSRYAPNLSSFIITSDILGIIQYPTHNTDLDEYISYMDTNNNFEIEIMASQLTDVRISLTDDKGRLLPLSESTQAKAGNLAFQLSLKIEEIGYNKNIILS